MSSLARDFGLIVSGISDRLASRGKADTRLSQGLFSRLSPDQQKGAVERSRRQLAQMELLGPEVQEFEKLSVICRYNALKPVSDDVYTKLTGDMAWEVIDFGLNQIYRSDLVFQLGNYSIEEYETHSPWDLFSRPQSILRELQNITVSLTTAKSIVSLKHIAPYIIEETFSRERAQAELSHEFACPLADKTGKNQAFLSAFRFTKLSSRVVLFN